MQCALEVNWRLFGLAAQHGAQQLASFPDVLLAIVEHHRLAPDAPASLTDVLGDGRLVELLPTLNPVSMAGFNQAFAPLSPLGFVVVVWFKVVADREIGRVQVEDVLGKSPA